MSDTAQNIKSLITENSAAFDYSKPDTAVILAAGHGKRIKSQTSKMLHKVWEVPTVERVYNACRKGLGNSNNILVVGIKAETVISVFGKKEDTIFAHQEVQHGTGHAVQMGVEGIDADRYNGVVYILPGDMGLLDAETMTMFKQAFTDSGADMMVLTGLYEGDPAENAYGRIIRVKDTDAEGRPAGDDAGKVIEIKEHKDILSLGDDENYVLEFNGRRYSYSKQELIENNEFNSGVYAFNYKKLIEQINNLSSDNAQGEIYITDLIYLFNKSGYTVQAVSPEKQYVLMGFNDKAVLKEMNGIARSLVYEQIKKLVEIDDPDDFFIHENVVDQIIEMDKAGKPLEIFIGKGVYIGKDVRINYNLKLRKNVSLDGHIIFGENVEVGENTLVSTFPGQKMTIENNVEILQNNNIKGNTVLGEGSRIESNVNLTGSDEHPLRIGKNVVIRGVSYIYGSTVEDFINIDRSIIEQKKVVNPLGSKPYFVRYYMPMPQGVESVKNL